jgi:uncharacterized membrane protein YgdD (TMEM256/DUF423 family)
MDRTLLLIAAFAGFTGVTLGAFGAHGLRDRISPDMLTIYQTGVQYHLIHAVALLAAAALAPRVAGRLVPAAGWLFTLGIILFSGMTRLGMVTPLGGLAFLAGWALLALAAF